MVRRIVAGAAGLAAGVLAVTAASVARARRGAQRNADLWSRATRGVAEHDPDPRAAAGADDARRSQA